MLSKCANPSCPTTFRYLHEGKLYVIAPGKWWRGTMRHPQDGPRSSSMPGSAPLVLST
jgi:hypothetical protein